jgi:hypothetical protein
MSDDNKLPIRDKIVLDYDQVAAITGLSKRQLRRDPDLKRTRLSTRRIGIRADHLEQWLDSRVM